MSTSENANQATDVARDHAHDAVAGAKDRAGEVAGHAGDAVAQVAGTASEQAQNVKAETVRQVRNLTGEATGVLSSQTKVQTQRLTAALHSLGEELKGMAEGGQSGGTATELAHQGSERVHSLASYLDGKEPAQILDDARAFARRSPAVFLAGSALLGLVAGRVGRGVKDAGEPAPAAPSPYPSPGAGDTDSARGFTSSTTRFTGEDPLTGALVPDRQAPSDQEVS